MYYFNINVKSITAEALEAATEILNRMGWGYEVTMDELLVNVPAEDGAMFDFIFSDLL